MNERYDQRAVLLRLIMNWLRLNSAGSASTQPHRGEEDGISATINVPAADKA